MRFLPIGTVAVAACHPPVERQRHDAVQVVIFEEPVPSTPRFARLTHLQWENSVRDLLRLPARTGLSASFLGDALSEGFENDAEALEVAPELWLDWQWAAETVAHDVVADPELYAQVGPRPRARDRWIRELGGRAHRRPLTDAEVARYATLYDQGPALVGSGDDDADGALLVISALLQSPWFLYRTEEGTVPDGTGNVPLSSFELASRLSFALWNTMPDDALFAAAEADALRDVDALQLEAERLLDDRRALETVADLHRQLLRLDTYANIVKDPILFPEFGPTTPASMVAEVQAFVGDVVAHDGSISELLTAPRTFVNDDLAAIYGVRGPVGPDLVPVELDPAERAGLLTLSGFLALEADAAGTSPIRRGVLVNEAVLCTDLPPPPDVVPPLPPPDDAETTRERVDRHTGAGTCGEGCHSTLINPIGFAYEGYDAVGRHRTEENGHDLITGGTYPFADGERWFGDAVDLARLLAEAPEVHACYAGHWLSYLHGRVVAEEEGPWLDQVGEASLEVDAPIRDLVLELVLSDAFRWRAAE